LKGNVMSLLTLEEAQSRLPEVIHNLAPGEEVIILEDGQAVARLVAEPARNRQPRQPGSAKGMLTIVQEDDEHLRDFAEYMP
jgi:antitoxin (DNA-binding transcriptional repressor) of toxin-antitoxin stability system